MKYYYLSVLFSCMIISSFGQSFPCDSIFIENTYYKLTSISEGQYNSVVYEYPTAKDTIPLDYSIISISEDGITLNFQNGNKRTLENETSKGEPFKKYNYVKTLTGLKMVHIKGNFWEGTGDYLYSLNDGRIISLSGEPLFSPDRNHFLTLSFDYYDEVGYLSLYRVKGESVEIIFEKSIPYFEIQKLKWSSNSTIVFYRSFRPQENCTYGYVEMEVLK